MAELVNEDFDGGSGTLTHSTDWATEGTVSLKINGAATDYLVYGTGKSPWMHYLIGAEIVFSTKEAKRGKPRRFFVHRVGETRVEVIETEWVRQFEEARRF